MSVSANGMGSARERVRPLALPASGMLTLMEDAVSVDPLTIMTPGHAVFEGKRDGADTSSDRKSLGSR
jgi:hypothetical protein